MGETRQINMTCAIEATVYALAVERARENNETMSTYMRNLIIWDLVENKKLDQDSMAMIMTGQAIRKVKAAVDGNNS